MGVTYFQKPLPSTPVPSTSHRVSLSHSLSHSIIRANDTMR